MTRRPPRRRAALVATVVVSCAIACARIPAREETELAAALALRPGMAVADVGAGDGALSVFVAREVGPDGRVFATEIDADAREEIRAAVAEAGLSNVTVVTAGAAETGLPDACCDAIFLRDVYHHLTRPAEVGAGLLRALRAGGTLAVIDFPPTLWLAPWTPEGVPESRGGHGVPAKVVVEELTALGFESPRVIDDWPGGPFADPYCVVVRKPAAPPAQ